MWACCVWAAQSRSEWAMPPHKRGPAASVAEMDDMARGIEMTDLRDDNARLRGPPSTSSGSRGPVQHGQEGRGEAAVPRSVQRRLHHRREPAAERRLESGPLYEQAGTSCVVPSSTCCGWLSVGGSESLSRPSRRSRCPCSPPPPRCSPGRTTSRASCTSPSTTRRAPSSLTRSLTSPCWRLRLLPPGRMRFSLKRAVVGLWGGGGSGGAGRRRARRE